MKEGISVWKLFAKKKVWKTEEENGKEWREKEKEKR